MKCVIYSRVSTPQQRKGLDSQIITLREWAEKNNHKVAKVFKDIKSGYKKDVVREDFESMLDYVQEKDIKLILCWEISRFGRSFISSMKRLEEYQALGVRVYFVDSEIDTSETNPHKNFHLRTLMSLAELEREEIVSRFKRGRDVAITQGIRIGMPTIPYGIKVNGKGKLVKNKKEAEAIEIMFDALLKGKTYYQITKELKKYPTRRGGEWGATSVRRILMNPLYMGVRKYLDDWIPLGFSFVDAETWIKAHDIIDDRRNYFRRVHTPRTNDSTHKFRGRIKCGHCNRSFGAMSEVVNYTSYNQAKEDYYLLPAEEQEKITVDEYYSKIHPGGFLYAYRCAGFMKKICDAGQIKQSVVDNALSTMVMGSRVYLIDKYEKRRDEFDVTAINKRKTEIEKELRGLQKKIEKAGISFEDHGNRTLYNARVNKHKAEASSLRKEKSKIEQEYNNYYKTREPAYLKALRNPELSTEDINRLVERINLYQVNTWGFEWTKLPKKYYGISVDEKKVEQALNTNGKIESGEGVDQYQQLRGMNEEIVPHNDKVIYAELYLFNLAAPIKAVFTNISENLFVGDELQYNEESRHISTKNIRRSLKAKRS